MYITFLHTGLQERYPGILPGLNGWIHRRHAVLLLVQEKAHNRYRAGHSQNKRYRRTGTQHRHVRIVCMYACM